MPCDEVLAQRGGGASGDRMVVRAGLERYEAALKVRHVASRLLSHSLNALGVMNVACFCGLGDSEPLQIFVSDQEHMAA